MIDEMFIRVNLAELELDGSNDPLKSSHVQKSNTNKNDQCCFYFLPVDPYDMLAHFYPSVWYTKSLDNCTSYY